MKRIYIFDIDGTLTPPRLPMTEEMVGLFTDFCKDHKVFLATGSDIVKVEEQVPLAIRQLVKGIFTCSGNKFFQDERVIYEKEFSPPKELIRLLEDWLKYSSYPVKTGHHLEIRPGVLNFSTERKDNIYVPGFRLCDWRTDKRRHIPERDG